MPRLEAGERKLLCMWWFLEKPVKEKEKEKRMIGAGKWDHESTVRYDLCRLLP